MNCKSIFLRTTALVLLSMLLLTTGAHGQESIITVSQNASLTRSATLGGRSGVVFRAKTGDLVISSNIKSDPQPQAVKRGDGYEYELVVDISGGSNRRIFTIAKHGTTFNQKTGNLRLLPNQQIFLNVEQVEHPIYLRHEDDGSLGYIMGSPTQALIELNSEMKLDITCDSRLNALHKGGRSRTGTYVDSLIIDVSTFQELKDRETDLRQQLRDVAARIDDGAATLSDQDYDALQSRQAATQADLDKTQQQLGKLLDIIIRGDKTNELHIDYNLVKGLHAKGKLRFVVVSLSAANEQPTQGDARWNLTQAKSYEQGTGDFPKNLDMALYWYEKAAEGGNYEAQEYLADVLYEGKNGYAKNPAKALRWNEICARRGHANAMLAAAKLYQQQGDDKNAIRWYARYSEDHNDSYIFMQIAQLYADHAPEKNQWLRRAADSGHTEAAYLLAKRLAPTDAMTAAEYYEKAVNAGNARAMYEYGTLLKTGQHGFTLQESKGNDLIERAASAGYPPVLPKPQVVESRPEPSRQATASTIIQAQADKLKNAVAQSNTANRSISDFDRYDIACKRLLTESDLRGLSKRELRIMRNWIFARHGYIFKTAEMKAYFSQQPWYQGRYNDVSGQLTSIEQRNIAFIKRHE